ncbi:unnamed protein product [Lactuca saligna]|uniref:Uncharacterized protein n=1 Tax=Lactuca saligna TaxID=75948 RepID=A0AA36E1J5_LACSI|nr:unnamed protein product [Lactuca saligna]
MHFLKKKCGLGSGLPRSSDLVTRFRESSILIICYTNTMSIGKKKKPSLSQMYNFPQSTLMTFSPLFLTSEFCRPDIEFAHLFRTENILAKITYEMPEAQIWAEGPIKEPKFGYVYLKKKTNQKEFFKVLDKRLVPSMIL